MKTAKQIISEHVSLAVFYGEKEEQCLVEALKAYARQELQEASKRAKVKYRDPSELEVTIYGLGKIAFVDEESITSIELK